MNYEYHYSRLIETRTKLIRNKKESYFENHHIIPKCLGGSNKKINLVLLTPREHFLAHWLLFEIYKNTRYSKQMSFSFWRMCSKNKHTKDRIYSSRQYNLAKENHINQLKGNKHLLGYKFTDEQKNNIILGKSKKVKIVDQINNKILFFKSKKECLINFPISNRVFNKYLKRKLLFKNQYKIEYV
jgi:hypothetical protein